MGFQQIPHVTRFPKLNPPAPFENIEMADLWSLLASDCQVMAAHPGGWTVGRFRQLSIMN